MANTIALRKAYSTMLDEVYKLASLTAVLDGPNDLVKEGANANEILIPKLSMQGLANYNKQTGYVAGDVTLEYETKKCTYDRGRMFTVDAMDNIESAGVAFGRLSGEFLRTQVVPELDAWRLASYAGYAPATQKVADAIADAKAGIAAVVCSRTKDENDPVSQEVKEANACGASVAVSFHTNAGKGDGSESYYYATSAKGKKLAQYCEEETKKIGQNSRGVKTKNLAFTRGTKMVAVLCECAFIDNDKDNDIIDTVAEQKAFGIAYAKAILRYLGIAYKSQSSSGSAGSSSGALYRVQVGAFGSKKNAEKLAAELKAKGYSVIIKQY